MIRMQMIIEAVSKKQATMPMGPLKFEVSKEGGSVSHIAEPHADIRVIVTKYPHLKGLRIDIYDDQTEDGANHESSLSVGFDGDDWAAAEKQAEKVLSRYMKVRKVQGGDPGPQFYTR